MKPVNLCDLEIRFPYLLHLVTLVTRLLNLLIFRSLGREFYVSRAAQAVDLQEALEVEERTQQQLQAVTHEMERLRASGSSESCESLNSRLTEVEDLLSTCCQQEKALQEEVEILKTSLEKSQAALEQTTAEHQAVEAELLTLQNGLVGQSPSVQGEVTQVLRVCIEQMGVVAGKRIKK
ncbi:hypothetical protein GDO81_023426 [Engystomops pustulosus]|uniref:Uncharacterized protein n=1 Tax=Engystomops pustulosus TaxID=76066 RepID=A0AAV6YSY8_ENGPU|nr:hypothetical protein GDO81_023426 [Engystomops pustulosus]